LEPSAHGVSPVAVSPSAMRYLGVMVCVT
jgi:hypothetical protein